MKFILFAMFLHSSVVALATNSERTETSQLRPFISDGCSVPGHLTGRTYDECCMHHDVAYWMGGTLQDKYEADVALINCIRRKGAFKFTAGLWQSMLQNFGTKRWGAGWSPRRENVPLTAAENQKIANLSKRYFKFEIPVVKSFSTARPCPAKIANLLKNKTNLKSPEKTTCYDLVPEEGLPKSTLLIVYSDECTDGYFIYEEIKSLNEAPMAGFGLCADKILPEVRSGPLQKVDFKTVPMSHAQ